MGWEIRESTRDILSRLDGYIQELGLHDGTGPVDLEPLFTRFNVRVEYVPFSRGRHGISFIDLAEGVPPGILINEYEGPIQRCKTGAHEFIHITSHRAGVTHHSYDGQPHTFEEYEADCGAAYLLVPIKRLMEYLAHGYNSYQIGYFLKVPFELVELRFAMAGQLGELDNFEI